MDKIKVENIFAAVSNKSVLDPLLDFWKSGQKARPLPGRNPKLRPGLSQVKFWGTEGTVAYLKSKGFSTQSVVSDFDFGGRVKTLDKKVFAAILADGSKQSHLDELKKLGVEPIDVVIVDLYPLDKNNFPESMDIGGQALIRAAIKNYKNIALAFDAGSLASLVNELSSNGGSTSLDFRKIQAQKAARFIARRAEDEASQL